MDRRSSPGFTLVELLVVMSVLALLMALLISAVMYTRGTVRATKCANNLYQIGCAVQQYQSKRLRSPNLGTVLTGLGEYLDDEHSVWICPEVGTGASTLEKGQASYGINMCVHKMLGSDSGKIIAMDAHCDTLEYEGLDEAAWSQDVAPRHTGTVAVLYFDGHVEKGIRPGVFNPYDSTRGEGNLSTYWRPMAGRCIPNQGCAGTVGGLLAEYRPGIEVFSGPAVTRIDKTLTKPFGGQYSNIQVPTSTGSYRFSGRWTGLIRPSATGVHTFYISHDDACSVRIDGQLIYQVTGHRWVGEGTLMECTPLTLTQGRCVSIEITLVNYDGPTHLDLQWAPPGKDRQIIPSDNLFSVQP